MPTSAPPPWRGAAAWVASALLDDSRCAAVRILAPESGSMSTASAGRSEMLARVVGETISRRRFSMTVVLDESPAITSLSDVPAWTLPGPFGDALANPDPRTWVALIVGGGSPHGAFVAREYWIRRLVMARHLEAARFGVRVPLGDDAVILDLGLDLAATPGGLGSFTSALEEIEADSIRAGEAGAPLHW